MNILAIILAVILAVGFGYFGAGKLMKQPMMTDAQKHLAYSLACSRRLRSLACWPESGSLPCRSARSITTRRLATRPKSGFLLSAWAPSPSSTSSPASPLRSKTLRALSTSAFRHRFATPLRARGVRPPNGVAVGSDPRMVSHVGSDPMVSHVGSDPRMVSHVGSDPGIRHRV